MTDLFLLFPPKAGRILFTEDKMKDFNIVFGGFGSGKTYEIMNRVKNSAKNLSEKKAKGVCGKVYVLVPDQYTLAVEKLYMSALGEKLMVFVRVFSFKRFCRLALRQCGRENDVTVSDVGRNILALQAVDSVCGGFEFYPKGYKNVRFAGLLCEIFRNLKSRGISPEYFYEVGRSSENKKITDIAMAYGAYSGLFSDDYSDPDDLHISAAEEIEKGGNFAEAEIFVDQFKTFNAKERAVILALYGSGANVTVSALSDGKFRAGKDSPMWGVEKNELQLVAKIRKAGGRINAVSLPGFPRFETEDISHLAKNMFAEVPAAYEKRPENVSVYRASDLFDEAEHAAAEISKLVRAGYSYSDIAVTARDIDVYSGVMEPVFEEYGIPVFYHKKTPVKQKSPMTFILSVISVCAEGFSSENILSAFKTGFLVDNSDDVSLLERYFYKWPYAAKDFARPFVKSPSGFFTDRMKREDIEKDAEKLAKLNELREYFVRAASLFSAAGKRNTVRNYAKALYDVMTFVNMPDKIEKTADFYRDFEEHALYAEQLRVYDMIIKMLDETVLVSGDREISVEDFRSVFVTAAENTDIAILPTSLDRVVAGTVAMIPFLSQKAVFILGCADRSFPRETEGDALFTERELELLSEKDIELGKTLDEKVNYEKFLFSLAVSAAREKCFVSYPLKGLGTDAASEFVGRICEIFPKLEVEAPPSVAGYDNAEDRIVNDRTAFSFYSKTASKTVADYLSETPFSAFLKEKENGEERLSRENAERLFGGNIYLSPSNTNAYAKCPYGFFIEYGLKIKPENRAELGFAEFGNIIHKGLEKLFVKAENDPGNIPSLVAEFEKEELAFLFRGDRVSDSFRAHFGNVMKKLERILTRLTAEHKRSSFETFACEKRVGRNPGDIPSVVLPLSSGSVSMGGVADRIDVFHGEEGNFFRILDYKTKADGKIFSDEYISAGMDMQLLMYLCAVVENFEKALPAGVSYIKANSRPVPVSRTDAEAKKLAALKNEECPKKQGITLDNAEVIAALDENNRYSSAPELYGTEKISGEALEEKCRAVKETLRSFGERIKSGDFPKKIPDIKFENNDHPCEHCNYRNYCKKAKGGNENA